MNKSFIFKIAYILCLAVSLSFAQAQTQLTPESCVTKPKTSSKLRAYLIDGSTSTGQWKGKANSKFIFSFSSDQQINTVKIYFKGKIPSLKKVFVKYKSSNEGSYNIYKIKSPSIGADGVLTASSLPITSASTVSVQLKAKKKKKRKKAQPLKMKIGEIQFFSSSTGNNNDENNGGGGNEDGNNGGDGNSQSVLNWLYETDPIYWGSPAIGSNGTIYIGSDGGIEHDTGESAAVYALDSNGSFLWKYTIGANKPVAGAIALDSNENLYFLVSDSPNGRNLNSGSEITLYLYSVSSSGALRWKSPPLYTGEDSFGTKDPAIASDDTIYVAAGYKLYAFNPDGSQKWSNPYEFTYNSQFSSCSAEATSPAVLNGTKATIFLNLWSTNCPLYGPIAITDDGTQGTLKWNETSSVGQNEPGYSAPAIDTSLGRLYLGRGAGYTGESSYLYAFDLNDGSFIWKVSANGQQIHDSPSIASDGTVYFGTTAKPANTTAGVFYAVNPDGTIKWSYDTTSDVEGSRDIYTSPAIGDDGTVYITSESRYIYAFNPDGTVKKKYDLYSIVPQSAGSASIVHSSPAITPDGNLIVGDFYYKYDTTDPNNIIHKGAIYSISTSSTGLANSEWPRYRRDNRATGAR